MKKQLTLVAFVAVALGLIASPSWADYHEVQTSTVIAGVRVNGTVQASFTLTIQDVAVPNIVRSSISWSNITPTVTQWKRADQRLVLNSLVTDAGGGIKIQTYNKADDAQPRFVDPTDTDPDNADSRAGGLLRGTSGVTSDPGLPVAWSIKTSSALANAPAATDPNNGTPGSFQWLFMVDEYNRANGIDQDGNGLYDLPGDSAPLARDAIFLTMIRVTGAHTGQGESDFTGLPADRNAYVYFEANFAGAAAQTNYQTSKMVVTAFLP